MPGARRRWRRLEICAHFLLISAATGQLRGPRRAPPSLQRGGARRKQGVEVQSCCRRRCRRSQAKGRPAATSDTVDRRASLPHCSTRSLARSAREWGALICLSRAPDLAGAAVAHASVSRARRLANKLRKEAAAVVGAKSRLTWPNRARPRRAGGREWRVASGECRMPSAERPAARQYGLRHASAHLHIGLASPLGARPMGARQTRPRFEGAKEIGGGGGARRAHIAHARSRDCANEISRRRRRCQS